MKGFTKLAVSLVVFFGLILTADISVSSAQQIIPMMRFDNSSCNDDSVIMLYLYKSYSNNLSIVKNNCNKVISFDLNKSGTFLYTEIVDDNYAYINVYEPMSATTRQVAMLTSPFGLYSSDTDVAAYFDKDNNILYNGNSDGTIFKAIYVQG